jgi:hypothetical protein
MPLAEVTLSHPTRRATLASLPALFLSACGGSAADKVIDSPQDLAALDPPREGPAPSSPSTSAAAPSPTVPVSETPAQPDSPPDTRQFRTWDGGSGPSNRYWSQHLRLAWSNRDVGDWLDANGTEQGTTPYATLSSVNAPSWHRFDATTLVKKWLRAGENKGFMLRYGGGRGTLARWSGRQSASPPRLVVTLVGGGTVECPCLALAGFSKSSVYGGDTRQSASTSADRTNILQFELSNVNGEIASATVHLYAQETSGTPDIRIFECNPPRFVLGTLAGGVRQGLAAEVGEAQLKSHPDVIRASDFSNMNKGDKAAVLDGWTMNQHCEFEQLPDPDAPGTVMLRGSFSPMDRSSFDGTIQTMRADYKDPLRPPAVVETVMHCRLYIFLEDDWRSTRDANKMAIGWDLRMGWWNDAGIGYWASTTGNGGAPGTGLKVFAPAGKNGGSQFYDRWEYQGHSIRMEAGVGVADGNPYESLRPLQSYVYHLDQPTTYGQVFRLGRAVIQRGRWICLEQRLKINSVEGPFDSLGNGVAVPDGEFITWVDGVLVSEVKGLRWRRHREMGIEGPWINWYYGGKQATERTMHYRMNHLVVARQYIGPRMA